MSKLRSKYVCSQCGYESSGWLGKCPSCSSWNTLTEEVLENRASSGFQAYSGPLPEVVSLSDIERVDTIRIKTQSNEFDRVLGGDCTRLTYSCGWGSGDREVHSYFAGELPYLQTWSGSLCIR